jgi:Acyl-CoA reductase (LuxC)
MLIEQLIPQKQIKGIQEFTFENSYQFDVFDEKIIDFLNELSRQILLNRTINRIPAVVALAFWLRKGNISAIISENAEIKKNNNIKVAPIGIVFHVCPSNVDTMFIYSLALSLLAGNKNILRISKKLDFDFIHQLFSTINTVLEQEKFIQLRDYITVVSYGHEEEANTFFSLQADARIIWGGDKTVETFKKIPSKSRVKDFYFADRQSFTIINLAGFMDLDSIQKTEITNKFYNDSYTFDQKGCSSPQIIFFYEETSNKSIQEFYQLVSQSVKKQYETDFTSLSSLKLNQQVVDSLTMAVESVHNQNNMVTFVELNHINELPHTCGGGYFYIIKIGKLQEIEKWISKKIQTVATYGLTKVELLQISQISFGKGIDRIVPMGKALDFGYIWDGYNLIADLTTKQVILNL